MNINSFLYKSIAVLLGGLIMSYAWPVRGQFGHWWGSSIAGACAAVVVASLIPWAKYRGGFMLGVIWTVFGFAIGGEALPYGSLVDQILLEPTFMSALPLLFQVLFIGFAWGMIGGLFLGYGFSEVNVTFWDFVVNVVISVAAVFIANNVVSGTLLQMIVVSIALVLMFIYNLVIRHSQMVTWFGISGGLSFGLGFFIAVVILYFGNKGVLPGPQNWWTLRDQMWGGLGGIGLTLTGFILVTSGLQPLAPPSALLHRLGFLIFIPVVGALNLWNVYTKWITSTPTAPDLGLAWTLIIAGVVFLAVAALIYLFMAASNYIGSALKTTMLISTLAFCFFMTFFGIAKNIVYYGWGVWEEAFTLFLFNTLLFFLVLPFVLLGQENP